MMQLTLIIDLPTNDTAELEHLISEATASTRPARMALGWALQGALFRQRQGNYRPGHRGGRLVTVANDPKLKVNRHPWNRNPSVARTTVDGFLAAARSRLDDGAPLAVPFPRAVAGLVLDWLRTRLDAPPGA